MAFSDNTPRDATGAPFSFAVSGESLAFQVHQFVAEEALSDLYEVRVDALCSERSLDLAKLVGQFAQLTVHHSVGRRFWHGLVRRATLMESHSSGRRYQFVLAPNVWLLSRRVDSRIFQNQTVPEILNSVFGAAKPPGGIDTRFVRSYTAREYCVQYRESDLDFARRLMEEEGIAFMFSHADGEHRMVLTDDPSGFDPIADDAKVRFRASPVAHAGAQIVSQAFLSRVTASGRVTLADWKFESPGTRLVSQHDASDPDGTVQTDLEVYDFPGEFSDTGVGDELARVRVEELQLERQVLSGVADVRPFTPGGTFELIDHPSPTVVGPYLLTRVLHEGQQSKSETPGLEGTEAGPEYLNTFEAIPQAVTYRPPRRTPRPTIVGVQTARVVGPEGDLIHTDRYGRVRVQFHWDRLGKNDEQSSCWVRVSQGWSGAGWGTVHVPRIGQEVIVQFLDGDPDRPLVTGRLYNEDQLPPYELPDGATRSVWRSQSTEGGGYNEISFEDRTGSEEIFLHAQKDARWVIEDSKTQVIGSSEDTTIGTDLTTNVGDNEERVVGKERRTTIGTNEVLDVVKNRTTTVGADDTSTVDGNQVDTVKKDKHQTVHGKRSETVHLSVDEVVDGDQATTIHKSYTETVDVSKTVMIGGSSTVTVGGGEVISVGGGQVVTIVGSQAVTVGQAQIISVASDQQINVAGDQTVIVAKSVLINVGNATVSIKSNGDITVAGKAIVLDGSGALTVKMGGNANVDVQGNATVKANGSVTIKGSKVAIN